MTMKPPRDLSTEKYPREFYCALGPTEILATSDGIQPFIWEAYELDAANPVIEWPHENTDEEIRESLNSDECDCKAPLNFADPIHFGSTDSQGMFGGDHFCTATIRCDQRECGFEAVMRLVLTKRWHDGHEDEALSIGGP